MTAMGGSEGWGTGAKLVGAAEGGDTFRCRPQKIGVLCHNPFFPLNTEAAIHTHTFSLSLSLHPSGPGRSRKY